MQICCGTQVEEVRDIMGEESDRWGNDMVAPKKGRVFANERELFRLNQWVEVEESEVILEQPRMSYWR